jgi:hypothetical protein
VTGGLIVAASVSSQSLAIFAATPSNTPLITATVSSAPIFTAILV